jgi:hypothetical protein
LISLRASVHNHSLLPPCADSNCPCCIPAVCLVDCRVGKKGWTFSDQLADFQLLLYLCNFLSAADDLPLLCRAVLDREVPLDDGYQLLIRSIAGMD